MKIKAELQLSGRRLMKLIIIFVIAVARWRLIF